MAFTQFTHDMDILSKLSDAPNVDDGLTASQLKAKFDECGKVIKDYINNVLLVEAQERPKFTGLVKSNGSALVQAEAGTDYQAPMKAGTDYQTPLKAGTDYQTPMKAGTDYQTPLKAGTDYQTPLSTDQTRAIHTGTSAPASTLGANGDIYIELG